MSGYNPNPTGYAPVGKWPSETDVTGAETKVLSLRAQVVDLTARVAVLESLLHDMPKKTDGEEAAKDWLVKRESALAWSPGPGMSTPRSAWRGLVEGLELLLHPIRPVQSGEPHERMIPAQHDVLAIRQARAALAAARAVMGT